MNGYDNPRALTMHEIELIIETHNKFPKMTAEGIGTHVGQIMSDEYNEAHKKEIENDLLPPKHFRLTDTCVSSYISAVEVIAKGEPYKGCNISKVAMNEYAKKHGLPDPQYINRPPRKKTAKQITVEDLCPQEDVASQCNEQLEEPPESHDDPDDFSNLDAEKLNTCVSELTARDKKELARYAIDQHYFFLKQLTGVI